MSTPRKQIQNQGKPDHRPVASKTNKAAFDKRPHTPGPWKADKWATGYSVSTPEGGYTICRLNDCNNAEANAKLIAAAPDMLSVLQALNSWLIAPDTKRETLEWASHVVGNAIAKATA